MGKAKAKTMAKFNTTLLWVMILVTTLAFEIVRARQESRVVHASTGAGYVYVGRFE